MGSFSFTRTRIDAQELRGQLADPVAGGYASFEGWVRNHNEGLAVRHLEYEAFEALAVREGERIVAEAIARFGIERAACVHRVGDLAIGEMAVWVGVSARHRAEAFQACRFIIDEVKHRVPIWKKEHYLNGDSGWVNCERCAAPSSELAGDPQQAFQDHAHTHAHEHPEAQGVHVAHTTNPSLGAGSALAGASPVPDYSRQMALKEVGVAGQARLRATRVLVIGCGGLGVPVISYLAGAGIGRLTLVDADKLEPSNLHRQTLYALADVGQPKAGLAAARVRALNPDVDVQAHELRLDASNARQLIAETDLVIDCTDNFSTKFLLNDLCVQLGKPAVLASVYQYEGQLQVLRPGSACLRCLWPEATRDGLVGNCSEAGVLGPVPGIFGALQALEAMKLLLDLPGQLKDEVLVLDLLTLTTSRLRARKATSCPAHANGPATSGPAVAAGEAAAELTFNTLDEAVDAGFDLVDIREPREQRDSPLPRAARQIPMAELLHGESAFRPIGRTLLICASGRRSLAATLTLRDRGLPGIFSLRGGVQGLSVQLPT